MCVCDCVCVCELVWGQLCGSVLLLPGKWGEGPLLGGVVRYQPAVSGPMTLRNEREQTSGGALVCAK